MSLSTKNNILDIEDFKLNKLIEIPKVDNKKNIEIARLFKKLKTNIQFLNVNNKNSKIIYITSSYKNEGKSFITSNLAISYTEIGKKVLIIDSDLKNGKQAKTFNIPNNLGFSNLLSGLDDDGKEIDDNINQFIKDTEINNLFIITSGTVPPNPTELIASSKLPKFFKQLAKIFDVIIIDGTSTLATDEALILSRISGSTILVSDFDNTNKNEFLQAKEDIENVGGNIIGVVINKVYTKEKMSLIKSIISFINNISKKIAIKVKNMFNSKKIKLLEPGRFNENYNRKDIIFEKNNVKEENLIKNKKIEEKEKVTKNNIIEKNDDTIIDKNNNKKIDDNKKEKKDNKFNLLDVNNKNVIEINKSIKTENVINSEKIEAITLKNDNMSNSSNDPKENVLDENIRINEEKDIKNNDFNIVESIKPAIILKSIKNRFNSNKEKNKAETNIKNEEKTIDNYSYSENDNQEDLNLIIDDNVKLEDNTVIVIVDIEKGMCMAFNRNCYAEKLVRGFDKTDGFLKEHYSLLYKNKRIKGFMNIYNISKRQALKIDPLVYATLSDLDENIWLQEKKEENITDTYVRCITKEYEKNQGESNRKFNERCKILRFEELKLMGIEINYKTKSQNISKNITVTDKIEMITYSKYIKERKKNNISGEISNNKKIKEESKHNSTKEKQKNIRDERKKEIEVLKRVRKERNEVKRKKIRDEKEKKNKEKRQLREEIRKKRELERIKQREEARIEEELLGDNLYPKTKNNKDL